LRKGVLFDKVFKLANESLNENFGCLLVPLPIVAKPIIVSASTNKSRKAAVIQSNKAANSKYSAAQSFALISTLSINEKSLIPQNVRDTQRLAVIQAILMIIKLSGNMIEHRHLLAALNDIKLAHNDTGPLPFKDLDSFLELMKREKYILREKKNLLETESIYSWGPRAYIEFQPKRMANFLFKVMNNFELMISIILFSFNFRWPAQTVKKTKLNQSFWKKLNESWDIVNKTMLKNKIKILFKMLLKQQNFRGYDTRQKMASTSGK